MTRWIVHTAAALLIGTASAAFANPWDTVGGPPGFTDDGAAVGQSDTFAAGLAALDGGDYESAVARFTDVVGKEPTNVEAYNFLGYAHRKLQNFLPSLQNYNRALELKPDHTGAHAYIGETYLELGNLKKAEYHLAQLDLICLTGCSHYDALNEKVELYRANYSG